MRSRFRSLASSWPSENWLEPESGRGVGPAGPFPRTDVVDLFDLFDLLEPHDDDRLWDLILSPNVLLRLSGLESLLSDTWPISAALAAWGADTLDLVLA